MENSQFSTTVLDRVRNSSERRATTDHQIISVTFIWEIKRFSFSNKKCGEFIISPPFSPENHEHLAWNLQLYPKGQDHESEDYVSIFLNLDSRNGSEVYAKYQFAIENVRGELTNVIDCSLRCFSKDSQGWGRRKVVAQSVLSDEKNGLLPDDTLTVHCKVDITGEPIQTSAQFKTSLVVNPANQLMDDMELLLDNACFTDVVFSVSGVHFPAHKAIVTARCPVFSAMFQHQMQESRTNRVEVDDIEPAVFRLLLRYIYTSRVDKFDDMAEELLEASDKYGLLALKSICEVKMSNQLTVENSVKYLVLADRHSAHQLKESTIRFINRKAKTILKTSDGKDLEKSHPRLFIDLYKSSIPF